MDASRQMPAEHPTLAKITPAATATQASLVTLERDKAASLARAGRTQTSAGSESTT